MTQINIHRVKKVRLESKNFPESLACSEFNTYKLYITDRDGIKTEVCLFSDGDIKIKGTLRCPTKTK